MMILLLVLVVALALTAWSWDSRSNRRSSTQSPVHPSLRHLSNDRELHRR
jgi:hypothetical protein